MTDSFKTFVTAALMGTALTLAACGGGGDDEQLVGRHRQAPGPVKLEAALDPFDPRQGKAVVERWLHRSRIGAIGQKRGLLDDVEKPDGRNDCAFRIIVEPLEDRQIGRNRQKPDGDRRNDKCRDEANPRGAGRCGGNDPGQNGTSHEELAMRNIHDPHDAKDKRQTHSRQRQHRRPDRAFDDRKQQMWPEFHGTDRNRIVQKRQGFGVGKDRDACENRRSHNNDKNG